MNIRAYRKIAVDMDEVLFPMIQPLNKHYRMNHKKNHPVHMPKKYSYSDYYNITEEESKKLVETFYKSIYAYNSKPLSNAVDAMKTLSKTNTLYIVTGRQNYKHCKSVTKHLINKYFNNTFQDIYYTNSFSLYGEEIPKAEICSDLGIDVLIDDSIHNCVECEQVGIRGILFGLYPWNANSDLTRIESWDEPENFKYLY